MKQGSAFLKTAQFNFITYIFGILQGKGRVMWKWQTG